VTAARAPRAWILATGSELTRGETRDANGPFLAAELTVLGIGVERIALLPDEPAVLARAIAEAQAAADVVLVSGGLGPTADDHTVRVVAEVFGRPVRRHPEAERRMRERVLRRVASESEIPENYWKQSEVVEGAEVLLNPVGLAPGMLLDTARGVLVVLPGVPRELEAMFSELAAPRLLARLGARFALEAPRIFRAKILGHPESWAEARIQALGIDFARVEYGISARPGELLVKFIAHRAPDHAYVDQVRSLLEREFAADILVLPEGLGARENDLEHSRLVHEALLASGLTVAAAESCTAGLIAKRLTDHAGSSASFLGGVAAYADRVKEAVLGVPPALIREHGAVSEAVCAAMARGARRLFGADLAVATTGVAGPGGGSPEKPVGLVYVALAAPPGAGGGEETVEVERHRFWGDRRNVRALAALRALELLRRAAVSATARAAAGAAAAGRRARGPGNG
jgi:nicotinamide-nucleotide amidase